MSDASDLSTGVIKEEVDLETWGLQEVDSPPLGDKECDMPQQGAALSAIKYEIDIDEHDLRQQGAALSTVKVEIEIDIEEHNLQHPRVQAMLASRGDPQLIADNKESLTTSHLTLPIKASLIKQEEEPMFSSTVVQFSSCRAPADHASSAQSEAKKGPLMGDLWTETSVCKNKVTDHIKREHRDSLGMPTEEPLKCNQCEHRSTSRQHLERHLKTHTGERPFKCDQCEYRSHERYTLKRHLKMHTGEKPFKCNKCEYRCYEKCALKRHLKMHAEEKPFKCNQCDYRCKDKYKLKCHFKMHTGEKPLK